MSCDERDEREHKLPKWAQQQLSTLRMMYHLEKSHNEELMSQNPAETDTLIRHYNRPDWNLPRGSRITFNTKHNPGRLHQSITCYVDSGKLHIQGDYGLELRPRASNSLDIRLER